MLEIGGIEKTSTIKSSCLHVGTIHLGSNLVDPASSHMLVLKTKPCMSKYKYYTAKLRMAH